MNMVTLAIRRGKYNQAEKLLSQIINSKEFHYGHHKLWFMKGILLLALEKYKEAIESFRKALNFNKYYYSAYIKQSVCYRRMGDLENALKCIESAYKLNKEDPEIFYQKSIILMKKNRKKEAVSCFENLLELSSDYFREEYERTHQTLEFSTIQFGPVIFLGVEHGCLECIQAVKQILQDDTFNAIGVELDFSRLAYFFTEEFQEQITKESKLEAYDFTSSDPFTDLFYEASIRAWYAYKTFPGQEMLEAIFYASEHSIPFFLLDQDVHKTFNEIDIEKGDWNNSLLLKRDLKMVTKLHKIQQSISKDEKILCIVGRAHLYGIYRHYQSLQKYSQKIDAKPFLMWGGE